MGTGNDRIKAGAYDFATIERRWQDWWERAGTFRTPNPGDVDFDASKPKLFILDFFPYPSGAGLHVGHPIGYCATDIYCRYKRMRGFNVLHPMGYDAFGLPAEQYAIETGVHPAVTTRRNIDTMRRQLKSLGFSYDWSREVATCEPEFYRFTQWIFLQHFNSWFDPRCGAARPVHALLNDLEAGRLGVDDAMNVVVDADAGTRRWGEMDDRERRRVVDGQRLAYIDDVTVNWCPALGTVLANEEVTNEGLSDRGNYPVYRRPLRQWMMRITRYADRLLADLETLDWPDAVVAMQRNWIGRSSGAEVDFPLLSGGAHAPTIADFEEWKRGRSSFPAVAEDGVIRVYTTRPDTLHGATYMVLAPEHPLVDRIVTDGCREAVVEYVGRAKHRSDLDRTTSSKEKTGVFTGAYATNPVNGRPVPVWVADYVLMGYGTGAIMAVPGGDERDFEFAKAFDLDIIAVVEPPAEWAASAATSPKGTLSELRDRAMEAVRSSARRWQSEDDPHRAGHVATAEAYLRSSPEGIGPTPEALAGLYVMAPKLFDAPYTGEGVAVQSPAGDDEGVDEGAVLNGLPSDEAKRRMVEWLEMAGVGRGAVKYKLRDWIFSRQKYWGEPFPVLHGEDGSIVALEADELPLKLPEVAEFRPEAIEEDSDAPPRPPLARIEGWLQTERDGKRYTRDVNTMPQWAGSCWYYLRFISPNVRERFCDAEAERYWMPVDLYMGGAEHAVLHLLYARFWHKVLFDLGQVSTAEPFQRLVNQGMVQTIAYRDAAGRVLPVQSVEAAGAGKFVAKDDGRALEQITAKMSKALKNTVSPDEIISQYGTDTFRMYEMYMGPIESSKPWNTRDVPGLLKLLQRIWRLVIDEETGGLSESLSDEPPDEATRRLLHKTIKRISEDIEQLKFNTAIAQIFEFVNAMTPRPRRSREVMESFVLLVSPFAPHLGEELWERLGYSSSLAYEGWPVFDAALARDEEVEIAVQLMGKVRTRMMMPADADEAALESAALADHRVREALEGKTVRKVIVVKGRLVNIVAN